MTLKTTFTILADCCYGIINAECRINVVVMLNVIKMSVIMQRVIVLSVVAPHIYSPMIELLDFFVFSNRLPGQCHGHTCGNISGLNYRSLHSAQGFATKDPKA